MKQYIDIARNILTNGKWKGNRTGIRCLTTFCEVFRHNMSDGFPLLTTKKMGLKNIATELEFFIKGLTSKKWLQDRNCHIWDEWANPVEVEKEYEFRTQIGWQGNKKDIQPDIDDLGPVYGYQWRSFGRQYPMTDCFDIVFECGKKEPYYIPPEMNGLYKGFDQLKRIVDTLKSNPNDRRMVCSAWNPNQEHLQALPPCHVLWNVVHIDGVLNLSWFQRSNDFFCGNPYNIASYALLLMLLCKESGLIPGELTGIFTDCHIYENHLEQIRLQLDREPYTLPTVEIPGILKSGKPFSIFDWTYEDFSLTNYKCHPSIKAEVAV